MNEIQKKIDRVLDMFDSAFIYKDDELILHKKWNVYFRLDNITSVDHFDYKMLSHMSFYTASNHFNRTSAQCKWARAKLNRWFRKDFSYSDLQAIYTRIGVGANESIGLDFIASGLDMSKLERKEPTP